MTSQVQSEAYVFALRVDEVLSAPGSPEELGDLARTFRRQSDLGVVVVDADGIVLASEGSRRAAGRRRPVRSVGRRARRCAVAR